VAEPAIAGGDTAFNSPPVLSNRCFRVSLTPRFIEVFVANRFLGNCFNSFHGRTTSTLSFPSAPIRPIRPTFDPTTFVADEVTRL